MEINCQKHLRWWKTSTDSWAYFVTKGWSTEGQSMSSILIIAEHDGQDLNASTARCVACAGEIPGGEVTVAVLGSEITSVASQGTGARDCLAFYRLSISA